MVVAAGHSVLLPCAGLLHPSVAVAPHLRSNKNAAAKSNAASAAASSSSGLTISWRGPDGQDIGIVDTFRAQFPNGSLYITSLEEQRGLTGNYQCVLHAEGVGTIVSRAARVSIARLPELYGISDEQYAHVGQTAYFRCLAGGTPEYGFRIVVQWLKDEVALRLDDSRMTVFGSGALEIDELRPGDSGVYQCQVTAGVISK